MRVNLVKSAWSHIKPGGNVLNKKEFLQQKLEEGCLVLRKIILCATYSIFYIAPGILYISLIETALLRNY